MNEKELRECKLELAKILVKYGINLPNKKYFLVTSCLDDLEFTNMVIEECYKAGAKRVLVEWVDDYILRTHYKYGDKETLSTYLPFEKARNDFYHKNYIPQIIILTEHFDSFVGIDMEKVSYIRNKLRKEKYKNTKFIFNSHWTGTFIPSISWAKELFPKLTEKDAMNKAWEMFFKAMRVKIDETDKNTKNHLDDLKKRSAYLNSLNIDTLHYTSKNGTDLTVGLTDKSFWIGGTFTSNKTKRAYNPNFPTEEVFTTPHKDRTNGVVYASKPLSLCGKLIEGISFKFKNGRMVEIHAKKNEKLLKTVINADENCRYLGECALVPFSSPINKALPLFYSTIYDENACCHLAFGLGFDVAYKGGDKLTREQLVKKGVNFANNHIDFMIGTKDLKIEAKLKNGKKVLIFNKGEWVK